MDNSQFSLSPTVIRLLVVLIVLQAIRAILPPEFDFYLLFFLGFDLFRGGDLNLIWIYGAMTSVFVHGGWLHLVSNATWIVVLSPQIYPHLQRKRFVAFFVATGTIGALTHALLNWGESQILVGASGAVFGLLGAGAYVMIRGRDGYSKATVKDIAQYILVMMVVNIGYAVLSDGNVSWEAHAGGFFAGLVLFPFMRRRPPSPTLTVVH